MSDEKELSSLPESWNWAKLGDVCQVIAGQSPDSSTYNNNGEGLPFYQGKTDFGKHHPQPRIWCSHPVKVAEKGDILVCVRAPVGPTNVASEKCCIGRGLAGVRATNVKSEFILYFLKSSRSILENKGSGSTFQSINTHDIFDLDVPLPSSTEQIRLVSFLNEALGTIEIARSAIQAQLEAAKALPDAILRAAFDSKIAQSWPCRRLASLAIKIGSGVTPRGGQSTYKPSGIPLIRSQNVHLNRFEKKGLAFISPEQDAAMSGSRVVPDDVLFNITGASIGRVCIVPEAICPANVNQHVCIIRGTGEFSPAFLSYFLSQPAFQKTIMEDQAGATRQALTKTQIENFQIPLPSLETQQQIVAQVQEKLAAVETLTASLRTQLDAIDALPAQILARAFRGEYSGAAVEKVRKPSLQFATRNEAPPIYSRDEWRDAIGVSIIHLSPDKRLGRVKLHKLFYFAEATFQAPLEGNYLRYRNGPYDGEMIDEFERRGRKEQFLEIGSWQLGAKGGVIYHLGENGEQELEKARAVLGEKWGDLERLVRHFGTCKTETIEHYATLFAVWNDFLLAGKTPTDDEIIDDVLFNWHRNKQNTAAAVWRIFLRQMKADGWIPKGSGPITRIG